MSVFKSHGKLLLTGEYLVLDGAKALAVPTKFGQTLKFKEEESGVLKWLSYDEQNTLWFEATFKIQDSKVATLKSSDIKVSQRLETILNSTLKLNSEWLQETKGYNIETYLDFNRVDRWSAQWRSVWFVYVQCGRCKKFMHAPRKGRSIS